MLVAVRDYNVILLGTIVDDPQNWLIQIQSKCSCFTMCTSNMGSEIVTRRIYLECWKSQVGPNRDGT